MSQPLVSVLMPVYNAERYVARAIESILAQTFADFEFIIIDDGSTDGSSRVLERFERRDRRIRRVSRENRGLVATLNEMLEMSRGEFVARMDADDISLPRRFALQVAFLREHPDFVCLSGAHHWIDERGRTLFDYVPPSDDEGIQEALLHGECCMVHPGIMMRREVVLAAGGYDPEMKQAEDFDLWLKLGERGKLANLKEFILKYRVHDQSKNTLHMEEQGRYIQHACLRAWKRRGIEPRPLRLEPSRRADDRSSKHNVMIRFGWSAMNGGQRWNAFRLGFRSVCLIPWRADGWWLVRAALIPSRKRVGT